MKRHSWKIILLNLFFLNLAFADTITLNGTVDSNFKITTSIELVPVEPIHITIDDVSKYEGDSNTTEFLFTVSLDQISDTNVSFWYTVTEGSAVQNGAVEDADYIVASAYITIPAGEMNLTIAVDVYGDFDVEADERFFVDLY